MKPINIVTECHSSLLREYADPLIKMLGLEVTWHLPAEFDPQAPGFYLFMGPENLAFLAAHGVIRKKSAIGSSQGKLLHLGDRCPALLTYSYAQIIHEYSLRSQIDWSLRLAARYLTTGSFAPIIGNYRYVKDLVSTISNIERLYAKGGSKPVPIVLDLETMGLVPYFDDKHIVSVQVSYQNGQADVLRFNNPPNPPTGVYSSEIIRQMDWLLNTPMVKLRGANLKYDLTWIELKMGVTCTNYVFDTNLAGSLLNENRSNSLEMHSKEFLPMGGYDDHLNTTYDKSQMEKVPNDDFITYAGGDTDACYQIANIFILQLLQQPTLLNFYSRVLHPGAQAFRAIELEGLCIDMEYQAKLRAEIELEMQEESVKALKLIPRNLRIKHRDNLSLTKPSLLKDYFFSPLGLNLEPKMVTEKTGEPSTAIKHIQMFEDDPLAKAFLSHLSVYSKLGKAISTYIDGFNEHLRPDGRFHPVYHLFVSDRGGATTGRLSASDPAIQTIPKHSKVAKRLRKAYIAPPGYEIMQADYSQGELKVIACLSGDKYMLDIYRRGEDSHIRSGIDLYNLQNHGAKVSYEQAVEWKNAGDTRIDKIRQGGKSMNFGLIYLISAQGFVTYARDNYGVVITIKQAEDIMKIFFKARPGLTAYHEKYINFAQRNGYVVSPLGRVRHLPLINCRDRYIRGQQHRRAVNSPVQSTLSDLTLKSASIIHQKYPTLKMCLMTHDSINFYIPIGSAAEWGTKVKDVMENLPLKEEFGWEPQLKFTVDIETGPNLAELKKYKL